MENMTMENSVFDDEGVELCKPIEPKRYVEMRINGMPIEFGQKLAEHFESIGFIRDGSGVTASGERWYRFEVDK